MMHNALEESSKRGKLATEDLIYLVRKVRPPPKPKNLVCDVLPQHNRRTCSVRCVISL